MQCIALDRRKHEDKNISHANTIYQRSYWNPAAEYKSVCNIFQRLFTNVLDQLFLVWSRVEFCDCKPVYMIPYILPTRDTAPSTIVWAVTPTGSRYATIPSSDSEKCSVSMASINLWSHRDFLSRRMHYTHYPVSMHSCQQPKYDFCISQGSVATVLRWGGQNYSHLRQVSWRCCKPKIITFGQCFTELLKPGAVSLRLGKSYISRVGCCQKNSKWHVVVCDDPFNHTRCRPQFANIWEQKVYA